MVVVDTSHDKEPAFKAMVGTSASIHCLIDVHYWRCPLTMVYIDYSHIVL